MLFNVSQPLLHFQHLSMVTSVFAEVVTELDSGTAIRSGDFDNDVQGLRLFSSGLVCEVICNSISMYGSTAHVRHTGEESSHSKGGVEASLFGNGLIFEAVLNV